MTIQNPQDIRRVILGLDKLENAYASAINATKRSIDPQAPEKELMDCLVHYNKEIEAVNNLKESVCQKYEIVKLHAKAAS